MPKREIHGIYDVKALHTLIQKHILKKSQVWLSNLFWKKKRKEKHITQYENEQITLSLMAIYYKPLITF